VRSLFSFVSSNINSIEAILKAAGAGLHNIIDLTVFLVDMKDYAAFNEVQLPS